MLKHSIALSACCLLLASPSLGFAHGRREGGIRGHQAHHAHNVAELQMKSSLDSASAAASDLESAFGALELKSKQVDDRSSIALKVDARLPIPSATAGIADAAGAAAAEIHVEISRNNAAVADCTLAFVSESDSGAATRAHFQLRTRSAAKSVPNAVGACANGMPAMQPGDSIVIYGVVNSARVDLLDNK